MMGEGSSNSHVFSDSGSWPTFQQHGVH